MEIINNILQKEIDIQKKLTGISSGLSSLDRLTFGLEKSDLIVIASRPGMGKTGFVLSMSFNMIISNKTPILFISLESKANLIAIRLLSIATDISIDKLRTGNLEDYEWQQLSFKSKFLKEAPFYIQTDLRELQDIQNECRLFKDKFPDGIIIIDNLNQIINTVKVYQTRDHEVGDIIRELKALAKEINMPIIATSFVNRELEKRPGDKKPMLCDIKDTGEIENVADVVCFIHRPEYYGIMQNEEGNSTEGEALIIIVKNRKGDSDTVSLHYRSELSSFEEWDQSPIFSYSTDLAPF